MVRFGVISSRLCVCLLFVFVGVVCPQDFVGMDYDADLQRAIALSLLDQPEHVEPQVMRQNEDADLQMAIALSLAETQQPQEMRQPQEPRQQPEQNPEPELNVEVLRRRAREILLREMRPLFRELGIFPDDEGDDARMRVQAIDFMRELGEDNGLFERLIFRLRNQQQEGVQEVLREFRRLARTYIPKFYLVGIYNSIFCAMVHEVQTRMGVRQAPQLSLEEQLLELENINPLFVAIGDRVACPRVKEICGYEDVNRCMVHRLSEGVVAVNMPMWQQTQAYCWHSSRLSGMLYAACSVYGDLRVFLETLFSQRFAEWIDWSIHAVTEYQRHNGGVEQEVANDVAHIITRGTRIFPPGREGHVICYRRLNGLGRGVRNMIIQDYGVPEGYDLGQLCLVMCEDPRNHRLHGQILPTALPGVTREDDPLANHDQAHYIEAGWRRAWVNQLRIVRPEVFFVLKDGHWFSLGCNRMSPAMGNMAAISLFDSAWSQEIFVEGQAPQSFERNLRGQIINNKVDFYHTESPFLPLFIGSMS